MNKKMGRDCLVEFARLIIQHNARAKFDGGTAFTTDQLDTLANGFREVNLNFDRAKWIGFINGRHGPRGGVTQ